MILNFHPLTDSHGLSKEHSEHFCAILQTNFGILRNVEKKTMSTVSKTNDKISEKWLSTKVD